MSCFVVNPSWYLCFVGEVARYWRQVGIGLRTKCFSSRCSAGTLTKPTCAAARGQTPGFTSITRLETQRRFP